MSYFVSVGDQVVTVDVDGDRVTVDGVVVTAQLDTTTGSPELRVVLDGVAHRLALDGERHGVWRLLDRGTLHELLVEDERGRHIRLLTGAGRVVDAQTVLKAPMPGLVVRIMVQPGDQVAVGTPLVALEAMKMENELKAAAPGLIQAIMVAPGQAVEKGQVLLELAPPPAPTG